MIRSLGLLWGSLAFIASALALAGEIDLNARLAAAQPGQTVELPAGEFQGGVMLPPGVSLKGAGYNQTVIDAKGCENGVAILGGSGNVVSDLAVKNAARVNILVRDAENAVVRRVRATGGAIGISLLNARRTRVENAVSDSNRYGIVISGGEDNAVVNCTAAGNVTVGLSLSSGKGAAAFNNCITGSTTAVVVGEETAGVILDYNLYHGTFIGKFKSQIVRQTLDSWQYLSGLDAHSVSMAVKYENPAAGKFGAVNVLDWSLERTATAKWGISSLAGNEAPKEDIEGKKRPTEPGVGAFETSATPPRPPAGIFTVPPGEGIVSAGVFGLKGRLVA
ncbi:MAG: right-handed parallel beta-helix repeat-containing protein, partial [Planctomycetota bacterium]|nr:right-handed parallel beta-helix repeat-containing protein [Planctomycetota bacterium]